MEMTDLRKAYQTPLTKVVETKSQDVLCASPCGENTQRFFVGNNRFDESDWD